MDDRPVVVNRRNRGPVADGRTLVFVAQAAAELRAELAVLRVDDVFASVFHGHARGRKAVLLIGPERIGYRRVPAEGLEVQRWFLLRFGFGYEALEALGGGACGNRRHLGTTSSRRGNLRGAYIIAACVG